jgi:regulator of protease activity HflC (stomatin/prohibitin superfamily)
MPRSNFGDSERGTRSRSLSFGGIGLIVVVVLGLIVAWDGYYTVDATQAAIVKQWGALSDVTFEGLHFKIPFAQTVEYIDLKQQTDLYNPVEGYTADQQIANMSVGVQWHVNRDRASLEALYRQYTDVPGVKAKLIDSNLPTFLKNVFGQYTAVKAIQDRAKLNSDITTAIVASIGKDSPIQVEHVNVQDIKYDPTYERAITERNQAEVAVRTKEQDLAKAKVEADIAVAQATGQANSARAKAEGDRDAAIAAGNGKASAIKAVSDALTQNPSYLELSRIEKWSGGVPQQMIPGATVPFINLGQPVASK